MIIGWPHAALLALIVLHVGINLALRGEPRKGTHSFGYALIRAVLVVALLWCGGFFDGGCV
ncbi:hypothetical protein ACODUN_14400 [Stenotrophomonas riyadhensis]